MVEIGMDQHKHFSYAVAMDDQSGQTVAQRLEHDDPDAIVRFVRSFGPDVRVSLETTGNWYWLVDLLEDCGTCVQLVNTVEARRLHRARNKTDRLDAEALARLSSQGLVPTVYVPEREGRDERERHRYRLWALKLRTRVKNRIHAILSKLNIAPGFSDLYGKAGRAFLAGLNLREPYGRQLASSLRLLDVLDAEIELARQAIRRHLKDHSQAALLMTIPGIGELTAYLLLHEIGPIGRFASHKHFASYACVAGGAWQSASHRRNVPVGRAGNLYLKAAFTESTLSAIRCNAPLRIFYERIRRRRGTARALVAVAHKLAIAVYYVLSRNQAYAPVRPTNTRRPGKPVLCLGA